MQQIPYHAQRNAPQVEWVFQFFSLALGCAFVPVTDPEQAAIIYGERPIAPGQVHIPIWQACYNAHEPHDITPQGYLPQAMPATSGPRDSVGLVFRLLNLLDEQALPEQVRDPLGNLTPGGAFRSGEARLRPLADEAVQAFKQLLVEQGLIKEAELLPRWPEGKQFAVLITHDTDGPCLLEPMELAKAGIKGMLRSDQPELHAFLQGIKCRVTGAPDPYFAFAHWADFEASIGAKSAFYLYAKCASVPRHLHNPYYQISSHKARWKILRQLADRGWEIGLHSSIHGLETDHYLRAEKNKLETVLGAPIIGNRAHYWSIDWRNPLTSFRRLAALGFVYDASLAWKDSPGFRSGTTLPYYPYDPETGKSLKLLELPTTIMDGHLFQYQAATDPHTLFGKVVQQVQQHGGVLHLDWHTRTWADRFTYAGWRSFLQKELSHLADTGAAWFTTPQELNAHWRKRQQRLQGGR